MAKLCAIYMRGKHKPTYDSRVVGDQGDMCVIVNASHLKATGNKKDQKLYRYHTQYFSGLKETNMRKLLEKDPYKVIYLAIKGMIPKNGLREEIIRKHLVVHNEMYHDQYAWMLPHFTHLEPKDINEHFSLSDELIRERMTIEFESDPSKRPEQFKGMPEDKNEMDNVPYHLRGPKTHTEPKENLFRAQGFKSSFKHLRKYKHHLKDE